MKHKVSFSIKTGSTITETAREAVKCLILHWDTETSAGENAYYTKI